MNRAVSFYRDVLGLPVRFESPGWTEFATDGATLALHSSEETNSEQSDPQYIPAGRCRPGLSVPNLDEFHKRMIERRRGRLKTATENVCARGGRCPVPARL